MHNSESGKVLAALEAEVAHRSAQAERASRESVSTEALDYLITALAPASALPTPEWHHSVRDVGGPGPQHIYECEIDGWTLAISRTSFQYTSGYGSYVSSNTWTRYMLVVVDPEQDVKGFQDATGDSRLKTLYDAAVVAHREQSQPTLSRFLGNLKARTQAATTTRDGIGG